MSVSQKYEMVAFISKNNPDSFNFSVSTEGYGNENYVEITIKDRLITQEYIDRSIGIEGLTAKIEKYLLSVNHYATVLNTDQSFNP